MNKTLYMGTTEVSAERTAMEIIKLLQEAGCSSIQHRYEGGKAVGLAFSLSVSANGRKTDLVFDLPVRVGPVFATLKALKATSGKQLEQLKARAERVAWRQLFRWLQAQLAMIQLGMVQAHEVFLPYEIQFLPNGERQTRFEGVRSQLMLPGGKR